MLSMASLCLGFRKCLFVNVQKGPGPKRTMFTKELVPNEHEKERKMLNKEEIKKIIPQREPFLMIDEVENYIPGESAIAYKYVNEAEWYFKGHFPGNPIMPGVLIAESLAQTGAVAILSLEENKGKNALFGGIDKMKFKRKVVPGDKLKLEVEIIKRKGPIGIGEAIASCDGKIVAKGELTFALV